MKNLAEEIRQHIISTGPCTTIQLARALGEIDTSDVSKRVYNLRADGSLVTDPITKLHNLTEKGYNRQPYRLMPRKTAATVRKVKVKKAPDLSNSVLDSVSALLAENAELKKALSEIQKIIKSALNN